MSELPNGWVEAEIGGLCDLINGKAFKPSDWSADGLPIVRIQNLNKPDAPYNRFNGDFEAKFLIDDGQLLFAWSGTPGTSFGAHVWNGGRALLNQHIFKVNFNERHLDSSFFRTAINHKLEELIGKAHGGVGLRHVTKGKFQETKLPLPPLAEQKRIVGKLDALSAKSARARDHLSRIETLTKRYKQAVLSKAFLGKFERVPLDDLMLSVKAGKNLRCEERPPSSDEKGVVKVSAVTWGEFKPEESKTLPIDFVPNSDTLISNGDFLFSRANTIELVGAVVIVKNAPSNLYLSDKVLRIDFKEKIEGWLLWYLRSDEGRSALMEISSGNQLSMRNISQKNLKSLRIPYAEERERDEIVRRIEAAFARIDKLAADAKRALALTDRLDEAILAKAFRGELVPQDPNDEPASTLLARIKAERAATPKAKRGRKKG
ncbi:restriction endonuclease subunit S [uncultured Cohaesibacter sp.]|uniref:restriction endonuclease subunit S n=1 Tax=uncultured Cohaesibacter sp. TaxID=1002546 RepID=UPI00292D80A2|nr:restriction endonuclease subunit S [uncultured Cohaesibacter sp.]